MTEKIKAAPTLARLMKPSFVMPHWSSMMLQRLAPRIVLPDTAGK